MLSPENYDTWLVYQILLTQSVNAETGLLRYDAELVSALCDLLGVEKQGTARLSGKILFMIDAANTIRLEKHKRQQTQTDRKSKEGEAALQRMRRTRRQH